MVSLDQVCDACKDGELQLLTYWRDRQLLPDLNLVGSQRTPLETAARYDQLQTVQWLLTESGQRPNPTQRSNLAYKFAAAFGHLAIVKYLHPFVKQSPTFQRDVNDAFQWSTRRSHTAVAKWLSEVSADDLDVTRNQYSVLRNIATFGQVEILKVLLESPTLQLDLTVDNNLLLTVSVAHGQHAFTRWLLLESGQPIDLTQSLAALCQTAVSRGDLDMLLLLLFETPVYTVTEASEQLRQLLIVSSRMSEFDLRDVLRLAVYAQVGPTVGTAYDAYDALSEASVDFSEVGVSVRLMTLLDTLGFSATFDDRQQYLQSAALRNAVEAGLIGTAADVAKLMKETATPRQLCRRL